MHPATSTARSSSSSTIRSGVPIDQSVRARERAQRGIVVVSALERQRLGPAEGLHGLLLVPKPRQHDTAQRVEQAVSEPSEVMWSTRSAISPQCRATRGWDSRIPPLSA
jgi:hypothetical protein